MISRQDLYKIETYRSFGLEIGRFYFDRLPSYFGSILLFGVLVFILSGATGESLGLTNLFRDRPDVHPLIPLAIQNSPTLWTAGLIAFSSLLIMVFPSFEPYLEDYTGKTEPDGISETSSFLFFLLTSPIIFLILVWLWLNADSSPAVEGEWIRAFLGGIGGIIVFAGAFAIGILARWLVKRFIEPKIFKLETEFQSASTYIRGLEVLPTSRLKQRGQKIHDTALALARTRFWRTALLKLSFTFPLLACFSVAFWVGNLIPAVALLTLVLVIFLLAKLIWIFPPAARFALLFGLILLGGSGYSANVQSTGEGKFKHSFDNIISTTGANQYENAFELSRFDPTAQPPDTCGSVGAPPIPVDFATSLNSWKDFQKTRYGIEKPKLVLVATSGGAYRASFWTSLVMDRLIQENNSEDLVGIADGVRLITGASGGMVGAAYFTMTSGRQPRLTSVPGVTAALETDILKAQFRTPATETPYHYPTNVPVPRDSLTAVAQHLFQSDLRSIFKSGHAPIDRGKVLEAHWDTLRVPFDTFSQGEIDGWRPSIILTPMIVETGQPLIISNLDLGFLPKVAKSEAIEMFSLFPCARKTFHLSTAVRMSATFPFISPAVSLPTTPKLRVVDAGYYDNYGVSFLNALLSQSSADCIRDTEKRNETDRPPFCFREWVREETSGVLLIEIRAFGLATEDEIGDACVSKLHADVSGSFEFLTSPIEAVLSARSRSMVFRNEQGRRRITQFDPDLDVERVVFANCINGSMNWIVPPDELAQLQDALDQQWSSQRARLAEIWKDTIPAHRSRVGSMWPKSDQ
ncbi:MAG: hypothetical protein AAFN80_14430 [Pseudomonadota bacterium]